jgi:hypothetical protein
MKKIFSCIVFGYWLLSSLVAQDLKQDILKLNNIYSTDEFYAEIGYKFFANNTLVEEYDAINLQKSGSYYFKIKDLEILNNTKCQLMVNHSFKTISVMPANAKATDLPNTKIPLDTALKDVKNFRYKVVKGNEVKYSIHLKRGEYKTVEIYFNKQSFNISKLKLHVSDDYAAQDPDLAGGVLEITYKTFAKSIPNNKKHLLSEKQFIDIKKGAVNSKAAYKNYELNDYLNIKPE